MNQKLINILLIGSGGREHALAWKLSLSNRLNKLYIAPGNAGTALIGINAGIAPSDFDEIRQFVIRNQVGMVVVGPEDPLVNGICDFFLADETLRDIPVIGPVKSGARLEGSKNFAKIFMEKYNIPTAGYRSFTLKTMHEGLAYLESRSAPYVLKADGLAAGKGVIIAGTLPEAKQAFQEMLCGKFGEAGRMVVVEEFLDGTELSVFALTDGKNYIILPEAKDYKRIGDNNTGPNTGGMGAISPVPFADEIFMKKIEDSIIRPTIKGLLNEGVHYTGFIFFGLINVKGNPFVIEYNVRLGDPETEAVLPRIQTDLIDIFEAVASQSLDKINLEVDKRTVATVVLVSGGYPEKYEKGKLITGLENIDNSIVFHAGSRFQDGNIITDGGRVLCVSAYGENIMEARANAYKNVEQISFDGKYSRTDIGLDLV